MKILKKEISDVLEEAQKTAYNKILTYMLCFSINCEDF